MYVLFILFFRFPLSLCILELIFVAYLIIFFPSFSRNYLYFAKVLLGLYGPGLSNFFSFELLLHFFSLGGGLKNLGLVFV